MDELEKALTRIKTSVSEKDYQLIEALAESYSYVTHLVEDKRTTIARLRKLLFGDQSETLDNVFPETGDGGEDAANEGRSTEPDTDAEKPGDSPKQKPKGHGRNGANDYPGASKVTVPHETLRAGDPCPKCPKGKVYAQPTPRRIVRIRGQAPLGATVYELERLRCNLCGEVFTAKAPEGIGKEKYDAKAASMIALLKYGSGLPFNRLAGLQGNLGIPLPPSTQWDIVEEFAGGAAPAYEELIRQAAQGEVIHNDDTTMRILDLMGERRKKKEAAGEDLGRKGIFTSGIVSTGNGHRIALFFTGNRHAGENLEQVLSERATKRGPAIQMCDALSRNVSKQFETLLGNCLTHGRRKFVDVAEGFPTECRHVLEVLREVYHHDAIAAREAMSATERLQFHQAKSQPLMEELRGWMCAQIDERNVEPNSGLGQAISYMTKRWNKLTLFLRVAGAPLDNNICERSLKKAILHRRSALFYKTENGARIGDLFMSLIHSCELSGANPLDYLTEIHKHPSEVASNPQAWMPWNYREALRNSQQA